MATIHSYACHSSNKETYWLMVMLGKNPQPVFVEYDAGEITKNGGNLLKDIATVEQVTIEGAEWTGTETLKYKDACSEHSVLGISAAAAAKAAESGFVFAGWTLEFYSDDKFKNKLDADGEKAPGDKLVLYTHARLIAQWEEVPMRTIKVTKEWKDTLKTHSDIVVTISGGGKEYPVTLGENNGWTDEITVPEFDAEEKEILYTAAEKVVPEKYTVKITGDMKNGFTAVNTANATSSSTSSTESKPESSRPKDTGPVRKITTPVTEERNPNTGAYPAAGISAALVLLCGAAAFAVSKFKQ